MKKLFVIFALFVLSACGGGGAAQEAARLVGPTPSVPVVPGVPPAAPACAGSPVVGSWTTLDFKGTASTDTIAIDDSCTFTSSKCGGTWKISGATDFNFASEQTVQLTLVSQSGGFDAVCLRPENLIYTCKLETFTIPGQGDVLSFSYCDHGFGNQAYF